MTCGKFANATVASALHKFGWVFGGTVRSTQGGHLRRGRRIPVSAIAAGRRHDNTPKGKARAQSGRPIAHYPSKYTMHPRRESKETTFINF